MLMESGEFNTFGANAEKVPPQKVIELLSLTGNEKIIDLGAGAGTYTIPLANKTSERVVAIDIEDEMLGKLEERAKEENIRNIDRMKNRIESLSFPDGFFHRAVAAFVLTEVDGVGRTIREIKRVLAEDGQLLVLDWEEVDTDDGPPMDQRIDSSRMVQFMEKEGFRTEVGHINGDIYYISAYDNSHQG
jgi:ubiquinone/menaquinone biosynthesis C-methylase UbiE